MILEIVGGREVN